MPAKVSLSSGHLRYHGFNLLELYAFRVGRTFSRSFQWLCIGGLPRLRGFLSGFQSALSCACSRLKVV
jgi:hypothetical protein